MASAALRILCMGCALGVAAAADEACSATPLEHVLQRDHLLVQAKPPGLSRLVAPHQPSLAQADELKCTFGKPVTISSHRFQNLQDSDGALNLHGDSEPMEQWMLSDAGNGMVTIKSSKGLFLADEEGVPLLYSDDDHKTKWKVHPAENGKVHLMSHLGAKLGDWEGALRMKNAEKGRWEEWFIAELDGKMACTSGAKCEDCEELASMRKRLMEVERAFFQAQRVMQAGCGETTTKPPRPNVGRCAVFGDPHFITFDGGHTTYVGDRIIWLVRSPEVWIQAVSRDSTGNFMGMAISGEFMSGHTLIIYNISDGGPLRATFDGERILEAETDEFHVEHVVDGWRNEKWDFDLHDDEILNLRTEGRFAVGPWPERFLGTPPGGLFMFRLPNFVEVTITGVDFMTAVITMPAQPGQSGYCGNFNGEANDDFNPVVPSWNTPTGESLGPVVESESLFRGSEILGLLATDTQVHGKRTLESVLRKVSNCPQALKERAEKACAHVSDERMNGDCVFDICATGDVAAADGALAAEIMELKVDTRGSVVFVGAGRCLDTKSKRYTSFQTEDVRTSAACKGLLQELVWAKGVLGAELMNTKTCQVLVEAGTDLANISINGRWKSSGPITEDAEPGSGLITKSTEDPAWSCWAVI